jgi:hypothetical protein
MNYVIIKNVIEMNYGWKFNPLGYMTKKKNLNNKLLILFSSLFLKKPNKRKLINKIKHKNVNLNISFLFIMI